MTARRSVLHRTLTLALAVSLSVLAPAALAGTRKPAADGGNRLTGGSALPTSYASLVLRAGSLTAIGRATLRGMR